MDAGVEHGVAGTSRKCRGRGLSVFDIADTSPPWQPIPTASGCCFSTWLANRSFAVNHVVVVMRLVPMQYGDRGQRRSWAVR